MDVKRSAVSPSTLKIRAQNLEFSVRKAKRNEKEAGVESSFLKFRTLVLTECPNFDFQASFDFLQLVT